MGVPTSVAAFVGYAARGLVDTPVQVNSWADYERAFGGLDPTSPMSYAVFLYFLNGGNTAQIVRAGAADGSAAPACIALSTDVILAATSPGIWGNNLSAEVDTNGLRNTATLFNLTITLADGNNTLATESYTGLSLTSGGVGSPGTAITTALASSALMNVDPSSGLTTVPTAGIYAVPTTAKPPTAKAAAAAKAATDAPDAADTPPAGAPAAVTPPPPGGSVGVDVALAQLAVPGDPNAKTGIFALAKADIFNMLCLPRALGQTWGPNADEDVISQAAKFCHDQRAMLILDPPPAWVQAAPPLDYQHVIDSPAITGQYAPNAAVYYPNLLFADPITNTTIPLGPCGAVAGVWASTDSTRAVWKAPAGTAAAIGGITDLSVHIDDSESGTLNPLAVNCLRTLPLVGPVSWGARTVAGADELASQWKYIPVRRTALFIEESLRRGTQWVVFEPNDEPLWSSVRLNVGAFMNSLFKQGAFQGSTPADAYLVQCDADNNPQSSINQGILNILVGFQPLLPAEFVIIQIQQLVGQLQG
jgi:phage tail sheath protein FI